VRKLAAALEISVEELTTKPFSARLALTPESALEMHPEAFERVVPQSSEEELVRTIKGLVGNQPARTRADLKKSLKEGPEKREQRTESLRRAMEIREELKKRGADEDPRDYLPDLDRFLDALGYE
jgi:hypothetical protein